EGVATSAEAFAAALAKVAAAKFDAIAPQLETIDKALAGTGTALKGVDMETFSSGWGKVTSALQPAFDVLKPLAEQILVDLKAQFDKVVTALGPLLDSLKPIEPILGPLSNAIGVVLVGAIAAVLV